jgi:hypothetical protein
MIIHHVDPDDGGEDVWNIGVELDTDTADQPRRF